jgi:hypothetical protein
MGSIVWLASYPKSGNTWMRVFLNNYLSAPGTGADLDSLDVLTLGGSSKSSFKVVAKRPVPHLTDAETMQLTPMAHMYMASRQPGPVFVKTHNINAPQLGVPMITPEVTSAAVYIVRNPLDVVISVADHYGMSLDKAIDFMSNVSANTAEDEKMVRQVFSTWSNHVQSWTEGAFFPVETIRYEDMLDKPTSSFKKVLQLVNIKPDTASLKKAIKLSSFKVLQNKERKSGFSERSRYSKAFFRSGTSGQWKNTLSPDQVNRIIEAHHPQMVRFNYIPDEYK